MAKYEVTRLRPRPRWLAVAVTIDYGGSIRFVEVKVPWTMVAAQWREVTDHVEAVFLERIRAAEDHLQPRLPGID